VGAAQLDAAVGGFLTFADPVDTPMSSPDAHGSGFDRLRAFADGLSNGVATCIDYLDSPPDLTDLPVAGADSGDLPLDDLLPSLVEDLGVIVDELDLEGSDSPSLPAGPVFANLDDGAGDCGGVDVSDGRFAEVGAYYCVADDTVYLVGDVLEELWLEAGDFAAGYTVLHAYATAVVVETTGSTDAGDTVLSADCMVGLWSREWFDNAFEDPDESLLSLSLSAGDLDEGIIGLMAAAPAGPSLGELPPLGTFERAGEFRAGFFGEREACDLS
jgi:hypothetical protein